jgi:hypothetical protein
MALKDTWRAQLSMWLFLALMPQVVVALATGQDVPG